MTKIEVTLPGKHGTRVSVVDLEEGDVFECERSTGTEIGVRTDDGWITVDPHCVTSYTDEEIENGDFNEFREVLYRPELTCTITIE
jgi:hypothetical protein